MKIHTGFKLNVCYFSHLVCYRSYPRRVFRLLQTVGKISLYKAKQILGRHVDTQIDNLPQFETDFIKTLLPQ